jgi:hypothetical protein
VEREATPLNDAPGAAPQQSRITMTGTFENAWVDFRLWVENRLARIYQTTASVPASGDGAADAVATIAWLARPIDVAREIERFGDRLRARGAAAMSGRAGYRKSGAGDRFWADLKERLAATPPEVDTRMTSFVTIEANSIIAIVDLYLADVGLALGHCFWKVERTSGADFIDLPAGVGCPLHRRAALQARLRNAVWSYARNLMKGEIK